MVTNFLNNTYEKLLLRRHLIVYVMSFLLKVSVGFNFVKVNLQQILHSPVFIIKKNFILSSNLIKKSHFLNFSIIILTYIEVKANKY